MHFSRGCATSDKNVNNSGTIQIAVVDPLPYLQIIFRQSVHAVLSTLTEGVLHPNSKSANILKAALRRCRISKVRQLFKGSAVFYALHRRSHWSSGKRLDCGTLSGQTDRQTHRQMGYLTGP